MKYLEHILELRNIISGQRNEISGAYSGSQSGLTKAIGADTSLVGKRHNAHCFFDRIYFIVKMVMLTNTN